VSLWLAVGKDKIVPVFIIKDVHMPAGEVQGLLCCMGFLFGFCSCKFSASQPLYMHIMNLCWNNVFFVMCSTLTGTIHGLGAILNYYNCKRTSHSPNRRNFLVTMLHACVWCMSTVWT